MEATIEITDMDCPCCTAKIEAVLGQIPGIRAVADYNGKTIRVTTYTEQDRSCLMQVLVLAGFNVKAACRACSTFCPN
ncbi:MAG: heavy-metal-associated domain-containing protein [Breznakibacter sp.]